jgi:kynurenine formamidase
MMQKKFISILFVIAVCFLLSPICPAKADHMKVQSHEKLISLPSKAKVIDLTQLISTQAPSYDGKSGEFKYEVLSSVAKDGYASGEFCTHEHMGTHMDAPVHFHEGGKTIAQLNPSDLILPIVVIDVRAEVKKDPDYLLTVEKIKEFEKNKPITNSAAILLLTGWDKRYFVDGEYRNADSKGVMHFPGFSQEAAQYLVDHHDAHALGIDTLSIDYGPSEDFLVHKLVLGKGLFMIENLTNLDQLPATGAVGIFAPLKIEGGTGSPARALALIPNV